MLTSTQKAVRSPFRMQISGPSGHWPPRPLPTLLSGEGWPTGPCPWLCWHQREFYEDDQAPATVSSWPPPLPLHHAQHFCCPSTDETEKCSSQIPNFLDFHLPKPPTPAPAWLRRGRKQGPFTVIRRIVLPSGSTLTLPFKIFLIIFFF